MKRSAALQDLSREHHHALSLARRIATAGDTATHAELVQHASASFQRELEPHFATEETDLLPRLAAAGEHALVERTRQEHAGLRALAARLANGDGSALVPFGLLLRDHVRFEERELFARAEALFRRPGASP